MYIHKRRFLNALALTVQESRKFQNNLSKTKQRERPLGCLYTYVIYIHLRGASALLVSTSWAMREPLNREASIRAGSTFFYVCTYIESFTSGCWSHDLFKDVYPSWLVHLGNIFFRAMNLFRVVRFG